MKFKKLNDEYRAIHVENQVVVPKSRRSVKDKVPPMWLKDFVSLSIQYSMQYGLNTYLSYTGLSSNYQAFVTVFFYSVERGCYSEAAKDVSGFRL